jgi:transitional endoplasmic reticulum ATPase
VRNNLVSTGNAMQMQLCPAQAHALAQLSEVLPLFSVVGLVGRQGQGKTAIMRKLHERTGGAWLCARELLHAMRQCHPLAIEETFEQMLQTALHSTDHVYLDDFSLLTAVVAGCGAYPRTSYLEVALESITATLDATGKKLIYASTYSQGLQKKGHIVCVPAFGPDDYAFFCRAYLGSELADRLDYRKVFRFARGLDGYDLKTIGLLLRGRADLDTDGYIEALRNFGLTSNVDLGEVQQVTLADLKGVDDIIESLEANVIIPLEQVELADELRLRPKRGVLLVGPPGTGKTTIGRALAHRLKSKFFLIDGTFIAGVSGFYGRVDQVFHEAKHNAPAIVFVDDSDAIFESGEELGLYRYLLTMLDGLESESAGLVCVMLTAMDVAHLPPALIRSGRIELWLEMRLPDATARTAILEQHTAGLGTAFAGLDLGRLVESTDSFTGADLKRLVDDGKNLLAHAKVRGVPLQPPTAYFLRAVATVRDNKARYAEAEARARSQRPARPAYFDPSYGVPGNGPQQPF